MTTRCCSSFYHLMACGVYRSNGGRPGSLSTSKKQPAGRAFVTATRLLQKDIHGEANNVDGRVRESFRSAWGHDLKIGGAALRVQSVVRLSRLASTQKSFAWAQTAHRFTVDLDHGSCRPHSCGGPAQEGTGGVSEGAICATAFELILGAEFFKRLKSTRRSNQRPKGEARSTTCLTARSAKLPNRTVAATSFIDKHSRPLICTEANSDANSGRCSC